jgi:hypothetical protein
VPGWEGYPTAAAVAGSIRKCSFDVEVETQIDLTGGLPPRIPRDEDPEEEIGRRHFGCRPTTETRRFRTSLCRDPGLEDVSWSNAVASSGDKQASAKLCCVEIEEVAVAFGPPA